MTLTRGSVALTNLCFCLIVLLTAGFSILPPLRAQRTALDSHASVRGRDLGIPFDGNPGSFNAITDVAGVEVGYTTLVSGEGKRTVGQGPVRTGDDSDSAAREGIERRRLRQLFSLETAMAT